MGTLSIELRNLSVYANINLAILTQDSLQDLPGGPIDTSSPAITQTLRKRESKVNKFHQSSDQVCPNRSKDVSAGFTSNRRIRYFCHSTFSGTGPMLEVLFEEILTVRQR